MYTKDPELNFVSWKCHQLHVEKEECPWWLVEPMGFLYYKLCKKIGHLRF
jgi:hypothetical protein